VLVPPPREQEDHHLQQAQPQHERPQRRAQQEQQYKVEARQTAIDQSRDGAGGQELAHDGVALEAHHQVAGGPPEEKCIREVHQVLDESRRQADVEARAQLQQQVAPQQRREKEVADDPAHGGPGHQQEVPVVAGDDLIHQQPGQQWKR
jgi:hypothetical protein